MLDAIAFRARMAAAGAEAVRAARPGAKDGQAAHRGRKPTFDRDDLATINSMVEAGETIAAVAAATGLARQTIYRVRDHRANAEAALLKWEGRA